MLENLPRRRLSFPERLLPILAGTFSDGVSNAGCTTNSLPTMSGKEADFCNVSCPDREEAAGIGSGEGGAGSTAHPTTLLLLHVREARPFSMRGTKDAVSGEPLPTLLPQGQASNDALPLRGKLISGCRSVMLSYGTREVAAMLHTDLCVKAVCENGGGAGLAVTLTRLEAAASDQVHLLASAKQLTMPGAHSAVSDET